MILKIIRGENMPYIKLIDNENKDVIIKCDKRKSFEYEFDKDDWKRVGIIDYYNENSDKYEKYEEITNQEAMESLANQKEILNSLWNIVSSSSGFEAWNNIYSEYDWAFDMPQIEQMIVGALFMGGSCEFEKIKPRIDLIRITNAVDCLFKCINIADENELIELRTHRNTGVIAFCYYKNAEKLGKVSQEKTQIICDYLEQKIICLNCEQKELLFGTIKETNSHL